MAKTAIFLATGFEEVEALAVIDVLKRAKIQIDMVSVTGEKVVSSCHKIEIGTDKLLSEADFEEYDMLILPGGMPGTKNLEACEELMEKVDAFYADGKYLAAICAAPSILGHRQMLQGKTACCYPGFEDALEGADVSFEPVCVADKIITARGLGCSIQFGLIIVEILCGEEVSRNVAEMIIWA